MAKTTAKIKSKTKAPARKNVVKLAPRGAKSAAPSKPNKLAKKSAKGKPAAPPAKPLQFPKRKPTAEEIVHQQSLDRFTAGLELMNQGNYAKAKSGFERLVGNPSRELAERAQVYLNICQQRAARPSLQLKTVEEMYDYAVSLANEGHPEQAEEHLRKALKLAPRADFLYYALAATFALRNDVEGTLEYLDKAIQINQRNRFQAQNDPDFENMLEDPRFTELIYPERPLS
ncbi:MAG: tetratricopeptide repeat protein [Acidobacteria bacterium]|nr:tetratricopeptide repeat protein [Acidobacteriota bacterium]